MSATVAKLTVINAVATFPEATVEQANAGDNQSKVLVDASIITS